MPVDLSPAATRGGDMHDGSGTGQRLGQGVRLKNTLDSFLEPLRDLLPWLREPPEM